jgi:hypothetical protein
MKQPYPPFAIILIEWDRLRFRQLFSQIRQIRRRLRRSCTLLNNNKKKHGPHQQTADGSLYFFHISSLGLIAPKLLLVGHNLNIVGCRDTAGIESRSNAKSTNSSANSQSLSIADFDRLYVVLGTASGACLSIASILVLLDPQIVFCTYGSAIGGQTYSESAHARANRRGTSSSLKNPLSKDVYAAASDHCRLSQSRSHKCSQCHSQYKEHCYSFNNLTPLILLGCT